MGKTNKKKIFTLSIYCKKCNALIYKYHKHGTGSLVKCHSSRIIKDNTKDNLHCLNCGQQFARKTLIRKHPIFRIIHGKVFTKGHCKGVKL